MKDKSISFKINSEIKRHDSVRLIYQPVNGEGFNKVVSWNEALKYSDEYELDLIEINGNASPAIIRLEDYNKFLFNLKKKAKEQKKSSLPVKEVQLRANISTNDMQIKANKTKEFIKDGHKVKVVLTFKGRENAMKDKLQVTIYNFIQMMEEVAVAESMPKGEGNKITVFLKKK